MHLNILIILFCFTTNCVFGQSKIDVIPWNEKVPKHHTDTIIRCDCPRNISYYLDSIKIDPKKVFIKMSNIESVQFVDHKTALWKYNDDSGGGIGFITSKEEAAFLPVNDFLSLKNIHVVDLNKVVIRVNNKLIKERDILIDKDADVITQKPVSETTVYSPKIIDIYTDEKELHNKKTLMHLDLTRIIL